MFGLSRSPKEGDAATNDCFAPSSEEYPHLPIHQPKDGYNQTGQTRTHRANTRWWRQLEISLANIGQWTFIRDYDELPGILWECWMDHEARGTVNRFETYLENAIQEGEHYIQMLTDLVVEQIEDDQGCMDFKEWSIDIGLLFSQVHRAIAFVTIRLDLVRKGLVQKYPAILCPPDMAR
jgi:hypothetical protein